MNSAAEPPGDSNADDSILGPSRRTVLAAERTWLAWWRTGIAVSAAAIAVGGVIPHVVDVARAPFIVLGAGYALLALAIFVLAVTRQRTVDRALQSGESIATAWNWMLALTVAGGLLALATLIIVMLDL